MAIIMEMGPLRSNKGDIYKIFTRHFQPKTSPFIKVTFSVGKVL